LTVSPTSPLETCSDKSTPRIGFCLLDGFEEFEAKLIGHIENPWIKR